MRLLDLTLPTVAENVALDEALLEEAEAGRGLAPVLRLWESNELAVIVGRSSRVEVEVDVTFCEQQEIPILRRASGGASVVVGPGCFMYSVILDYASYPGLQAIDEAHRFVLGKVAAAVGLITGSIEMLGTSDLTVGQRKFSGNSLRCKRGHLLYHGTILYDFPVERIGQCLRTPPRQPDYRSQRSHDAFVRNLPISVEQLRSSLIEEWDATEMLDKWPQAKTEELVRDRYALESWNYRL